MESVHISINMNLNSIYQKEITDIVRAYQKFNPQEMAQFSIEQKVHVDLNADKYASLDHQKVDILQRKLFDIPETLYDMLMSKLSDDAKKYLWNPNDRTSSGAKWFANTFKEFRSGQIV